METMAKDEINKIQDAVLFGDKKRVSAVMEIRHPDGKTFKKEQRVYLNTERSGDYIVIVKDSGGNVVETMTVPLTVPKDGNGLVAIRIKTYPHESSEAKEI